MLHRFFPKINYFPKLDIFLMPPQQDFSPFSESFEFYANHIASKRKTYPYQRKWICFSLRDKHDIFCHIRVISSERQI